MAILSCKLCRLYLGKLKVNSIKIRQCVVSDWIDRTHGDFGVTAIMGFVSLMGILVRNSVIMIDYADELRKKEKVSDSEAVYESAKRRMSPILLTSLAASMGVTPMILGGSHLWQPMGAVICYGTLITMFFILIATQPLYASGRIINGHRLSKLGIEVSRLNRQVDANEVVKTAEEYFWNIMKLKSKIEVIEAAQNTLRDNSELLVINMQSKWNDVENAYEQLKIKIRQRKTYASTATTMRLVQRR